MKPPHGSGDAETSSIRGLLDDLNSDDTARAEDAQHALQAIGRRAVEPVLRELPQLGIFGQLCVLELLTDWSAEMIREASGPTIDDVVIPLLASGNAILRQSAADVLGHVQVRGAIPALRQTLESAKRAGVHPAFAEPVALRRALTVLGDRHRVTPKVVDELARRVDRIGECWPAERLPCLIEALAGADQVLLYFNAWRVFEHETRWVKTRSYEIDLTGDWSSVVDRARVVATHAAESWGERPGTLVTLEWIGEADR